MIGIGTMIAFAALFRKRDIFFMLSVAWAFAGIVIKHTESPVPASKTITIAAAICAVLMGIGIIVQIFRKKVYH
jgi:hypothetical protein